MRIFHGLCCTFASSSRSYGPFGVLNEIPIWNPKPQTLNPKPQTLNPKSLNPNVEQLPLLGDGQTTPSRCIHGGKLAKKVKRRAYSSRRFIAWGSMAMITITTIITIITITTIITTITTSIITPVNILIILRNGRIGVSGGCRS